MKKYTKRYQELMKHEPIEGTSIYTDEEIVFHWKEDSVTFSEKYPGIDGYYINHFKSN